VYHGLLLETSEDVVYGNFRVRYNTTNVQLHIYSQTIYNCGEIAHFLARKRDGTETDHVQNTSMTCKGSVLPPSHVVSTRNPVFIDK
jgi:hypothetical protein